MQSSKYLILNQRPADNWNSYILEPSEICDTMIEINSSSQTLGNQRI